MQPTRSRIVSPDLGKDPFVPKMDSWMAQVVPLPLLKSILAEARKYGSVCVLPKETLAKIDPDCMSVVLPKAATVQQKIPVLGTDLKRIWLGLHLRDNTNTEVEIEILMGHFLRLPRISFRFLADYAPTVARAARECSRLARKAVRSRPRKLPR